MKTLLHGKFGITDLIDLNESIWKGRNVLVTGHTGFKGSWLTVYLHQLGCKVSGIGLLPESGISLFEQAQVDKLCDSYIADIRDKECLQSLFESIQPEVVFHLAAQSIVSEGYLNPCDTFSTNIMGTVNLLESIRVVPSCKSVVIVTSDKVYKPTSLRLPFKEVDELGGRDPYSASKAGTELVIDCYRQAFFQELGIPIAAARAGNVIGGGDWATARLIPDAIRAWTANRCLEIRHPNSVRPWQHVLEALHGYLLLGQKLISDPEVSGAFNFGPSTDSSHTVGYVIDLARSKWPGASIKYDESARGFSEEDWLIVDSSKSCKELGFEPIWSTEEAIDNTIAWYLNHQNGSDALDLCLRDIEKYYEKAS